MELGSARVSRPRRLPDRRSPVSLHYFNPGNREHLRSMWRRGRETRETRARAEAERRQPPGESP